MNSLNLDQFRTAFQSGGLRSVHLQASGGEFYITARPQKGPHVTLASTHGKRRRTFRNPASAIEILHRIGARKLEVDTSAWSPDKARLAAPKRPDTAARQRRAHQAARYDAWFREELVKALAEANDPKSAWETQSEVKVRSADKRAEWLRKAAGAKKARA